MMQGNDGTRCSDEILCIDTWEGGEEHTEEDMAAVEKRFSHNIGVVVDKFPDRVAIWQKGTSVRCLAGIIQYEGDGGFDFIYIDGSHHCDDVMMDAIKSFERLKVGGLMIFDDYLWRYYKEDRHNPAFAVNAFLRMKEGAFKIVYSGYQLTLQKTAASSERRQIALAA
jgi:hypothetical protein